MIDKVKGIVVEPNGIAHTFGHCYMIPNEVNITGEEHEKCFQKEVLASDWWNKYNVQYNYNHYFYSQLGDIIKQGFSIVQNNSSVTASGNRYISYTLALCKDSLQAQEDFLKNIYPTINKIMTEEESAYFELALFDKENSEPIIDDFGADMETVDEFYNKIGIIPEPIINNAKTL